ncbi:MAG TPA: hypothetical protein VJI12_03530 [archaeon]|nr:hypothetical protein [archaeon]
MKIVIKLGGSVCVGDHGPNFGYFRRLIPVLNTLKKHHQLIICVGGGKLTRSYGKSIEKSRLTREETEKIFIQLIHANVLFVAYATKMHPIQNLQEIKENTSGVIGGVMPRRSTDANAAVAAERIGADIFIKLTNVDGIYTKDPKKYKTAKKISSMTFGDLSRFAKSGKPNNYGILDATAINTLSQARIKTIVMNGRDPKNIISAINGENIGTVIE